MNRQIYKMTISDTADSITFYLLDVPIVKKNVEGTATNTTIDGNVFTDYMWLKDQWEQKWSIMCNPEWSKLDAIYKRQFSDADVPTLKVFYGDNIYTDGSAEGSSFQIMNDSEVYEGEIRGFSLYGNATQETIAGKNLLNTNALNHTLPFTTTSRGVTFKLEADGGITINGQNDGTGNSTISFYNNATPFISDGGSYTGDINPTDGTYKNVNLMMYDGAHYRTFRQSNTNTLDAGNCTAYVQVSNGETTTFSNYKIYPMLEAGSTKSPYEPYVGGIPSPNPDYPQDVETVTGLQTVKITGKNLFNFQEFTNYIANNGITRGTATYTSNSITMTATSNDCYTKYGFVANIPPIIRVPKNTDMVLSWVTDTVGTYKGLVYVFGMNANGGANIIMNNQDVAGKITFNTGDYDTITFRLGVNTSGNSITYSNIMLELGSQKSDYEPYQGTQSYEINLGGTNIFDKNSTQNDGFFLQENGATNPNASWSYSDYIPCSPNTTYTTSLVGTMGAGASRCYYNASKVLISGVKHNSANPFTDTTPSGAVYMRESYPTGSIDSVQIEVGSQATPYAPYTTYAYELAKIGTYQDYIYKSGDKWYKHAEIGKVVLDGSETWAISGNTNLCRTDIPDALVVASSGVIAPAVSDYFTASSWANLSNGTVDYGLAMYYSAGRIALRNKNFTTESDYTTWLSTHNTTVYYALATPTDTEITDSELIGQLEALLAGSLYKGTNNIFLIPSAGAEGTMELDYRINYEKETVVQDTMPVKLDLSDGGIINACLCRQNVQVIMRETVK